LIIHQKIRILIMMKNF